MSKRTRLTNPQLFVLADCADGPIYLDEGYKPRRRLLDLGLIEATPGGRYIATEAGHALLAQTKESQS